MIIVTGAILALLLYFGIEFLVKDRWLKPVLHFTVTAAISIAVFRFALKAGGDVERFDNAGIVADTLEFLEESTRSNSLVEIHAKLLVIRQELPKAIRSGEPTTPMLLKALDGEFSTNIVDEIPSGRNGAWFTNAAPQKR